MSATNLDNLNSAIDADRARLCDSLGLRRDGNRFFCFCQADGAKHSSGDLSVEAGFKCHKCGWKGNGLSLIKEVKGGDFQSAVEFARGVYGVAADTPSAKLKQATKKTAKIHADADAAVKAAKWAIEQRKGEAWMEKRRDIYGDSTGQPVAAVVRFDRADGSTDENGKPLKTYMPIHAVEGGWKVGDPPGKWPLFNLAAILATDGTVFICEGEKAASAGIGIGLTCTATAHGAKSPSKTDLEPLRNRNVVILPDFDKAGREYAEDMARRLHAGGASSVKIVNLPGLPKKGDIADYVALNSSIPPETLRGNIEGMVLVLRFVRAVRETALYLFRDGEGSVHVLVPPAKRGHSRIQIGDAVPHAPLAEAVGVDNADPGQVAEITAGDGQEPSGLSGVEETALDGFISLLFHFRLSAPLLALAHGFVRRRE